MRSRGFLKLDVQRVREEMRKRSVDASSGLLLVYLAAQAKNGRYRFASHVMISEELGIAAKEVERSLHVLADASLIVWKPFQGGWNDPGVVLRVDLARQGRDNSGTVYLWRTELSAAVERIVAAERRELAGASLLYLALLLRDQEAAAFRFPSHLGAHPKLMIRQWDRLLRAEVIEVVRETGRGKPPALYRICLDARWERFEKPAEPASDVQQSAVQGSGEGELGGSSPGETATDGEGDRHRERERERSVTHRRSDDRRGVVVTAWSDLIAQGAEIVHVDAPRKVVVGAARALADLARDEGERAAADRLIEALRDAATSTRSLSTCFASVFNSWGLAAVEAYTEALTSRGREPEPVNLSWVPHDNAWRLVSPEARMEYQAVADESI